MRIESHAYGEVHDVCHTDGALQGLGWVQTFQPQATDSVLRANSLIGPSTRYRGSKFAERGQSGGSEGNQRVHGLSP